MKQTSLVAALIVGVVLAVPAGASPTQAPRAATGVPGAVKLGADDLRKAGRVQCGRVGGTWVGGMLVAKGRQRGWFVSWTRVAANARAAAKRAPTPVKRKALLAEAAAAKAKATAQRVTCAPSSSTAASTAAPGPLYTPFRLSFANAAAVFQYDGFGRRGTRQAGTSNMDVLQRDGTIRNAVVSGSSSIGAVAVGPDGDVYTAASALGVPYPDGTIPSMCWIQRYSQANGSTTCVRTGGDWYGVWLTPEGGGEPMQIGPDGAVYFLTSSSTIVLMRSRNGVATALTNPNLSVTGFKVASNGAIVFTGRTVATGANWTRLLRTDGSLSTLANSAAATLDVYPDGRVYWGATNAYDPGTDSSTPWAGGIAYTDMAVTTDDKVFVINRTATSPTPGFARQYPTPATISAAPITQVTAIAAAGTRVAIAGTQANGRSRLMIYDPAASQLNAVDGGLPEMEFYNLAFSASRNAVIFDALRFQDNAYIVGEIALSDDSISILRVSGTRVSDVIGF